MCYVNLGHKGFHSPTGVQQPDFGLWNNGTFGQKDDGPFKNVQAWVYLSGTEYAPVTPKAWRFATSNGGQVDDDKTNGYYAWAVRTGDVAAVPEPEAYALLLAGLAVVGLAVRRRG